MSNSIYHTPNLTTNQQKWMSHYEKLCERARYRPVVGYVERHHILPECMGGIGPLEDKVPLTAEEHYLAHQLLAKIFPKDRNLIYAMNMMCIGKSRNNKLYGWIKRSISAARKGKTKYNDESLMKQSIAMTGRNMYNDEGMRKMAEFRKGKNKTNTESVARMSETLRKFPISEYYLLVEMKEAGFRHREIHCYFVNLGYDICYGHISKIYNTLKRESIKMDISIVEVIDTFSDRTF